MHLANLEVTEVLQLLPYANSGGTHGGKIRAREIRSTLLVEQAKIETIFLGDLEFIQESDEFNLNGIPHSLVGDVNLLNCNFKLNKVDMPNLRIILFEQPWAWNEVKRLKISNPKAVVVYSGQNVEHRLKEKILKPMFGRQAVEISNQIRNIEIEIAEMADYIVTVSQDDANWYSKFSKNTPVVAPNGTSVNEALAHPEYESDSPYGLVVGSAHPPNIEGCLKFLSEPELWLPKSTRIVVAGSLGLALRDRWHALQNRWGQRCVELISDADDFDLSRLINGCHVMLLPIGYGGGTNLKTAEALASGRPIVATQQAFRGFEEYSGAKFLSLVENSLDFKIEAIKRLMQPKQAFIPRDVNDLKWENTLAGMRRLYRDIMHA
jgi:glycosyltransferase involved in cell wall biosynthesis